MNWYTQSPPNSSTSEGMSMFPMPDTSSSQALTAITENVNSLISILRDPSDTTYLRTDLSSYEYEKMTKHISEAAKALNKIARDYKVLTPIYLSPLQLRLEDDRKISTPQTSFLVSSFKEPKHDVIPFIVQGKERYEPTADNDCIAIGTVFSNLEDAADEFEKYAIRCGFNTCKGNSKKDVYQEFACSARGKVRMRKIQDQSKQRNRKSIKKMCKCHIILRKKDDLWTITTRKLYHTHELLTSDEIKKTAKNRFIPEEYQKMAVELYKNGEAPAKIQYRFESELNERCTWSMKDLYNMLYKYKDSS